MKRKALLIGYSGWDTKDEKLYGVSKDSSNYKKYLLSPEGGAWFDDEIITLEDTNIDTLKRTLLTLKLDSYDIIFTVYSGHGEYDSINRCRNVWIDSKTKLSERDLSGLAPKQIIILDSCSGERETEYPANESRSQALLESSMTSKFIISRRKYEQKCNESSNQILKFYAAERGTYANDTSQGGVYSSELLAVLRETNENISIYKAHIMADLIIRKISEQKPDYEVPRLTNYLPGRIEV